MYGETALCRSEKGEPCDGRDQNLCFILRFLSLSERRKGFLDLLKFRQSSLFMLCGCISSWIII